MSIFDEITQIVDNARKNKTDDNIAVIYFGKHGVDTIVYFGNTNRVEVTSALAVFLAHLLDEGIINANILMNLPIATIMANKEMQKDESA